MTNAPRPRRWLFVLVTVLYAGIAVWRFTQGRPGVAVSSALVAAGFAVFIAAPDPSRKAAQWSAGALIIAGIAGQILFDVYAP